jgi:amino-acid N-acetyltransferase
MATTIHAARPEDADDVLRLLKENNLPLDGLQEHLGTTIVARDGDRIIGCAALEHYEQGALLRSVAVSQEFQGRGLGRQLTDAALGLARQLHVPAVFLLTTTAERYFPKFGFEAIARAEVPESVQASVEFTSACPSSAIVMRKSLQAPANAH